jgi:hypothetical protein
MAPVIYTKPEDTGYTPSSGAGYFGPLGDISAVTIHHSAGPRAVNKAKAIELHKAYQKQHISQGFRDIGYHWSMDDKGRFYQLRSVEFKGAHVGGWNTGNVGIMIHGNYEINELTPAQKDSLKWLFNGGFYVLTGERERDIALVRGHYEWPNNATACPGKNVMQRLNYLRNTQFHSG